MAYNRLTGWIEMIELLAGLRLCRGLRWVRLGFTDYWLAFTYYFTIFYNIGAIDKVI